VRIRGIRPEVGQERPSRSGQALVETAIAVLLFFTVIFGVMTFGHAVMALNMIRHAARDGAHVAATWPNRDAGGAITNTGAIQTLVQNEIASVTAEPFAVTVTGTPTKRCNGNGQICTIPADCSALQVCVPVSSVQVNVQGCVPWLFPILPRLLGTPCPSGQLGFSVNQTLSFDDEA
jgi:Flp pilus assembly protein TadG